MSFVSVGGDASTKPTYFEVVAADRLVPSLKAAIVYTLSVLSQRHPWVHRLLRFEDEVVALATLLLDWQGLSHTGATFSESLYGLKRRTLLVQQHPPATGVGGRGEAAAVAAGIAGPAPAAVQPSSGGSDLSRRQRRLALLCQVLLPYLRAKCDQLYGRASGPQGLLSVALSAAAQHQRGGAHHGAEDRTAVLRRALLRALVAAYPWARAAMEASTFVFHLLYMVGQADTHSPVMRALGMTLARVSAQDLMAADRSKQAARQARLEVLTGLWPHAAPLLRGGLHLAALLQDHSRNALIIGVFAFKALEWWYTSGEDRLAAAKALPPPPPPPPPRPSPLGVGLPVDTSLCPVCRQRCTNAAQLTASGFVFCYPCAFNYILQQSRCPVTQIPATLDHIRKLYDAS